MSSSSIVTWPVPAPRSASCRVRWRHSLLSWAGGLSHWRRVLIDSVMYDGLDCAFDQCAMGAGTEKYAQAHGWLASTWT